MDEDQVGINEKGNVKVWLNNHYESSKINGMRVNESKMVNDLLQMLNENTNHETRGNYPNIAMYIGNN